MPPKRKRAVNVNQEPPQKRRALEDSGEDDELLLSSRYIMEAVEITTPRSSLRASSSSTLVHLTPRPKQTAKRRRPFAVKREPTPTPTPKPRSSPSKKTADNPVKLYSILPRHLHACLHAQKRAILRALQDPPHPGVAEDIDAREPDTNKIASAQLCELLKGTVIRGEGNSCLVLGPRASGKSQLIDHCLETLEDPPIVLRLSGWVQTNDRLALREIAYQLAQQTGTSKYLKAEPLDEDNSNPFIDGDTVISLPPSSHLPHLISVLPTLPRSTIIILDGFDLFALHPRQSLLYCLLDTVQSCRAVHGNRGIAVVGVTSRVDAINLLEKRVKSRFSGRILRTAPSPRFESWLSIARRTLCTPIDDDSSEWSNLWNVAVNKFLGDSKVLGILKETYALARDFRMLGRLLVTPILELEPSSPYPSSSSLLSSIPVQRFRQRFPHLHNETYPSICLLIAAMHLRTAGQDNITFEMLFECFRDQVRSSTSAPVQVEGGGIGMVRCSREILWTAFERLEAIKAFVHVAAPSSSTAKEFVRYRCNVDREEVKKAVEKMGQINLKKWLSKAQ